MDSKSLEGLVDDKRQLRLRLDSVSGKEVYGSITFCHCDGCKKTNGTAFSSNAKVKESEFGITQGG